MYLLALQEISKVPFRVVDEINQGMDQRNERMMHKLMVETATKPESTQYFLVTPKLLSGLKYNEHMKIHCIMNGDHVPQRIM